MMMHSIKRLRNKINATNECHCEI